MNQFGSRIWLLTCMAVLPLVAGCSESRAPAMTQTSQRGERPTIAAESSDESSEATSPDPATEMPDETVAGAADVKPQATAVAKPPERMRDISFDDLKFDINKGDPFKRSLLTEKIEALDGKPVRIRGYILPSFQQTGLTQFVLVRDNLSCCFGPGAAIYDCVIVEMKPGGSTDYSLYPVAVDGTFTVREMLDPDGKAVAIYHLDGEQVR